MGAALHLPADAAFARALRSARRSAGLSQQSLAERVGVRTALVSKVEQGQRRVSIGEAAALAAALGKPLDEMVTGSGGAGGAGAGRSASQALRLPFRG